MPSTTPPTPPTPDTNKVLAGVAAARGTHHEGPVHEILTRNGFPRQAHAISIAGLSDLLPVE